MKEDFGDKTVAYLGRKNWTKNLGTKDKYERNLEIGRPLKKNPILKIVEKIGNRVNRQDKIQVMRTLKKLNN